MSRSRFPFRISWMVALAIAWLPSQAATARADEIGTMEVTATMVNPDGPLYQLEPASEQEELLLGQTLILKEGPTPIVAVRVISKSGRPARIQARQIKSYAADRAIRDGAQYTAVFTRRLGQGTDGGDRTDRREPDLPEDWHLRPKGFFEPLVGYMFGSYGSTNVSGLAGGLNLGVRKNRWALGVEIRFGSIRTAATAESGLASMLGVTAGYDIKRLRLSAGILLVDRIAADLPLSATSTVKATIEGNIPGFKIGASYLLKDWLSLNAEAFLHSYSIYNVEEDETDYKLPSKQSSTRFILSVSFPFTRAYESDTDFNDF